MRASRPNFRLLPADIRHRRPDGEVVLDDRQLQRRHLKSSIVASADLGHLKQTPFLARFDSQDSSITLRISSTYIRSLTTISAWGNAEFPTGLPTDFHGVTPTFPHGNPELSTR